MDVVGFRENECYGLINKIRYFFDDGTNYKNVIEGLAVEKNNKKLRYFYIFYSALTYII